jgi:hypothetical protein
MLIVSFCLQTEKVSVMFPLVVCLFPFVLVTTSKLQRLLISCQMTFEISEMMGERRTIKRDFKKKIKGDED